MSVLKAEQQQRMIVAADGCGRMAGQHADQQAQGDQRGGRDRTDTDSPCQCGETGRHQAHEHCRSKGNAGQ